MDMSKTPSTHVTDWLQFYQHNQTPPPPMFIGSSDATVVTTTATSSSSSIHLNPDGGRVSKPIRRRSRASRRTPTTLFNTSTSNFRAMVQQFTGGPSAAPAPASAVPIPTATNLNFQSGAFQYHHHQLPQFQQQPSYQHHQNPMFPANSNRPVSRPAQRLNNSSDHHGFSGEGMNLTHPGPSSSNEDRNYMF